MGETDDKGKKGSQRADILFTGRAETTTIALGMSRGEREWSAHGRREAGGLEEKQNLSAPSLEKQKENEAFLSASSF